MKILRLRVESFRGLSERSIEPLETGVTLIVGPNEAGKSSLAEALHLLLDLPASSTARRVKEVQPVGRDVGVEIELEARIGGDRVRYFKRYLKERETRLEIEAVRPGGKTDRAGSWSGREAHDRMQALLQETMDLDLWRALAIEQGEHTAPEGIGSATSLAAALDRAAGGQAAGLDEESLFDLAGEALARWYTPTGREKKELAGLGEVAARHRAEVERLDERLHSLEADAQRVELLGERSAKLSVEAEEAAAEAAERRADHAHGTVLAEEIQGLERALAEAESRYRLLDERRKADRELGEAEAAVEPRREAAATGAEALAAAEADRQKAAEALAEAEGKLDLVRRDEEHLAHRVEKAAAEESLTRAAEAREEVAELSRRLAGFGLDEALARRIETAERDVAAAEQALEVASPTARLTAEAALEVEVAATGAEKRRELGAGDELEERVSEPLAWRLAGLARFEVLPGAGVDELSEKLGEARQTVGRLCAKAGVADPEAARRHLEERRSLEARLRQAEAALATGLGGRTAETLAAEVERLAGEIDRYLEGRRREPELPAKLDEARKKRRSLEETIGEVRERARRAEEAARQASDKAGSARQAERMAELAAENAAERRRWVDRQLPEDLASRIGEASWEDLLSEASRAVSEAREALEAGQERLAEIDLVRLDRRAVAAEGAARQLAAELASDRQERRDLVVRLETLGEQGLYERREEAAAQLAEAERCERTARRQAAAARKLFDVLEEERELARSGYRGPLAEKITELGAPLFGDGFAVEVDENLAITQRIAKGVTLPVDQLSVGAQEQLSLLTRVACALLVAEEGGVPLILDDTLGHADPERTAAMARVLEEAGRSCQVIVLTASPHRFAAVEGARRIELGRQGGSD